MWFCRVGFCFRGVGARSGTRVVMSPGRSDHHVVIVKSVVASIRSVSASGWGRWKRRGPPGLIAVLACDASLFGVPFVCVLRSRFHVLRHVLVVSFRMGFWLWRSALRSGRGLPSRFVWPDAN